MLILNYYFFPLWNQSRIPVFWILTFSASLKGDAAHFSSQDSGKAELKQSLGTYLMLADLKSWSEK